MGELDDSLIELAELYAKSAEAELGDSLISIVLFGSVARRQCRPTSDIDLVAVLRGVPKTAMARRAILDPVRARVQPVLENLWNRGAFADFTETVLTADEAEETHRLYLEILEDGIILYDAGGFFARVLENLRAALRRMGAQRKSIGRLRYWDLKPDFRPGDVVEI
jgi:hypothetical protein